MREQEPIRVLQIVGRMDRGGIEKDADCIIVAVGHKEFRSLSMIRLKGFFKADLADDEKVLIDVKSLYRMDELKASGMRFWRL